MNTIDTLRQIREKLIESSRRVEYHPTLADVLVGEAIEGLDDVIATLQAEEDSIALFGERR